MNPEEKKEFFDEIYEKVENTKTIEGKERFLEIIAEKKQIMEDEAKRLYNILISSVVENDEDDIDFDNTWTKHEVLCEAIDEIEDVKSTLEEQIEIMKGETTKKEKITFIGSFFRKFGNKNTSKEEEFIDEYEEMSDEVEEIEDFEDELETEPSLSSLKTVLVKSGLVALATTVVLTTGYIGYRVGKNSTEKKYQNSLKELEKSVEELEKSQQDAINKLAEVAKMEQEKLLLEKEEAQNTKEENIVKLVQELQTKLNKYEGMNVTFEQVLSLFIHLNVGNSYVEENEYALDAVTRTNLIKQYYVGLIKGTEEFDSYMITDADLSKLSSDVFNIRNAAINRVIVLNDQRKYEESKEIVGLFQEFITEKSLQDEALEFTTSMQDMQTVDKKQLKEEIYKYYNYLFAGPKTEVRNFDDYGHYVDGDNKEMTFENQGSTMRFYTWFMDVFASINLSNNLVPQDIINSAQAKLLDQATLMRMLGYKNCANAFNAYYGIDFDNAIDNRIKANSKKTSGTKATGKSQSDANINNGLLQPGDTFTTSDGTIATVVETGDNEITVEIPGGNETTEDTTPDGPSEREETEGGGNEDKEEIVFPEDPTEEIIEEGGEIIQESSEVNAEEKQAEPAEAKEVETTESTEPISFEADEVEETASIRDEINQLLFVRQALLGEELVPNCTVYIEEEKVYEKTYRC